MNWTKEELEKIAADDDLFLSIPNADGTMHQPTWMWIVRVDDQLFARGAAGINSRWYVSALREKQGHLSDGGVEKDVEFEFLDSKAPLRNAIDQAYINKYDSYLEKMTSDEVADSTVKINPKD